ncbi:MAG TPA: hypothetical protein VGR21_09770 [Cryptosporangiaceae bacterium]|nr:hypothetical protein [Cryptosporangiaceae bacterium]
MYTSPDEARSDLFLAGAVFLVGPVLLRILLGIFPLSRIPGFDALIALALPLMTTILVPWLLIRYRKERLADYGLGGTSSFVLGLVLAAPIAAAGVLAALASGGPLLELPLVAAIMTGSWLAFLGRLLYWAGLVGLAVYMTVKARDAFRGDPAYLRSATVEIGRILALVAGVATVLLLVTVVFSAGGSVLAAVARLLLLPLGVAAAVLLSTQRLRRTTLTKRSTLLTPVVLFAIGPFALSLNALSFVAGLWQAALLAGVGLVIGALLEARRSALGPVGVGLALALMTGL